MTDDEFDERVARLAALAAENPGGYKKRLLLMALLGNAYLGAMLLLLVALLVLSIYSIAYLQVFGIELAVILGASLWLLLRALRVKIATPEGSEVGRRDTPELFAVIDEFHRSLDSPRFHHVLVTDVFNASVVQLPRLGIFGWQRNYLLIGLPLLKGLTVEQFKAVLAHEFGHLARGHGAFSSWIYRLRLRWARLIAALGEMDTVGDILFRPFFKWYGPAFAAYSFPLARANEYEADATSARLTSAQVTATALANTSVIGRYLEERYWPRIQRLAEDHENPAFTPFADLGQGIANDLDDASARKWLGRAMRKTTSSADTHPALADRLEALGAAPSSTLPEPAQCADRLLGKALDFITEELDVRWSRRILPMWRQHHQAVRDGRMRKAELDAKAAVGELAPDEACERARLTEIVGHNTNEALAQLRRLADRTPDSADVLFMHASILLMHDDDTGRDMMERAMRADEWATARGCEVLSAYYARTDRAEEARRWHRRLLERIELEQAAKEERSIIAVREEFEPHGLGDEAIGALRAQLHAVEPRILCAYLVKKRVQHLPHLPCYIFGVTFTGLMQFDSAQQGVKALQTSVRLPSGTMIFYVETPNTGIGKRLQKVEAARIL